MAQEMTSYERLRRVYDHQEPDRVPLTDSPWGVTVARWRREGFPADANVGDFFGFEKTAGIGADNGPRYPSEVIEETAEYVISTTAWGATQKNWKNSASTPDFLDFRIRDRETWEDAKARIRPTDDRVNWEHLERNYAPWRAEGRWIQAGLWFGYDVFTSWHVGTERMLMAMAMDPDWCRDMFSHALETQLTLYERVWDKGYEFDCISFPDDLGYRNGLFFSVPMYREVLKAVHKRAFDWAHDRGVKVMMHSCGNILELLPDLIEIGLDGLNPLETKAGMDLVEIKRDYGDDLVLQGGIDVRAMPDGESIEEEIRTKVTAAKQGGGYIYHSDHSVPNDVSFSDFCRVIALVNHYGSY